jgi:hypothetical protein
MKLFTCTTLITLLFATTAGAEPIHFAFNVAGYVPAESASGYAVNAAPGLTFTFETNKTLTWDQPDGFGVTGPGSYSYDEVEGDDQLVLRFSEAVHLLGFDVTDFFLEQEPNRTALCPGLGCYAEWGIYQLEYADGNRSLFNIFGAPVGNHRETNGALDVVLDHLDVVSILFMAPGEIFGNVPAGFRELHEFSLAGVTLDLPVSNVPEPTTVVLLATGLLALYPRRKELRW